MRSYTHLYINFFIFHPIQKYQARCNGTRRLKRNYRAISLAKTYLISQTNVIPSSPINQNSSNFLCTPSVSRLSKPENSLRGCCTPPLLIRQMPSPVQKSAPRLNKMKHYRNANGNSGCNLQQKEILSECLNIAQKNTILSQFSKFFFFLSLVIDFNFCVSKFMVVSAAGNFEISPEY